MQRLSVHSSTGHEIKFFVYFKEDSWHEDEDIKVFENFGEKVRARHCDFKTFIKYLRAKK